MRPQMFRVFLVTAAVLLLFVLPAAAQDGDPIPFDDQTTPLTVLGSYANAINLGDYERAYAYWRNLPEDRSFENGTGEFDQIAEMRIAASLPVITEGAAGSIFASVSAYVVIERIPENQSLAPTNIACFVVRRSNVPEGDNAEPDPNWYLYSAEILPISIDNIELSDRVCGFDDGIAGKGMYENLLTPEDLLTSYYNAITLRDYPRAYGYWSAPPDQTLEEFAAGFQNLDGVSVYADVTGIRVEGAAGSIYTSMPVLITTTQLVGDPQGFVGCFVMRRSNVPEGDAVEPDPNWAIHSASLAPMLMPFMTSRELFEVECGG